MNTQKFPQIFNEAYIDILLDKLPSDDLALIVRKAQFELQKRKMIEKSELVCDTVNRHYANGAFVYDSITALSAAVKSPDLKCNLQDVKNCSGFNKWTKTTSRLEKFVSTHYLLGKTNSGSIESVYALVRYSAGTVCIFVAELANHSFYSQKKFQEFKFAAKTSSEYIAIY